MSDFNPKLATWLKSLPCAEAGINNIQVPGQTDNIIWQTRHREPSRYEQALVAQLEAAFASGVTELEPLVAALNQAGSRSEGGEPWTPALFETEMARLGY